MNPEPTPSAPSPAGPSTDIPWSLVLGLGALALLRPLLNITGVSESLDAGPVLPVGTTLLITAAWVLAAVLARVPRPVLTLVYTGLAYGVLAIVLSAVLSPLTGEGLRGPLTSPFGFAGVLAVNAAWGLVAGAAAWAVRAALPWR
ncbi:MULTISPECIES: hypothetical protein [unclassified Nocardiopsis]|uniref:hypothetical protein n=1 Tax=unclassified Nocardiopsis TaxID=2649073 RepID=UPI00135B102B|nr:MULTISPECIES: hypothetical protein [unclassified Nocardiopsis]